MRLRTDERLLPRTVPACPLCCSGGVSERHFVAVWRPVPALADRTFRRPRRQSAGMSYLGGGRTAFADGRRGFLGCGVACAGSRRFIHRQRSATHLPSDGGSMNAALSGRSRRIAGRRRRRPSRCLDLPADPQCLRVAGNLLWRRLRCAVFCRPIARPTLRVSSRPLVDNSPPRVAPANENEIVPAARKSRAAYPNAGDWLRSRSGLQRHLRKRLAPRFRSFPRPNRGKPALLKAVRVSRRQERRMRLKRGRAAARRE